ncbi:MAG: DUF4157 domain-containing protein [Chloroflexi bacterium]|nr:DUF4157 domain-containing protein [Chloroflexota bacterium]
MPDNDLAHRKAHEKNASTRRESQPVAPPQSNASPGHLADVVRAAATDLSRLNPADLHDLQRAYGNRATTQLVSPRQNTPSAPIQRKLVVGAAHDAAEQEAERMADDVQHTAPSGSPSLRRTTAGPRPASNTPASPAHRVPHISSKPDAAVQQASEESIDPMGSFEVGAGFESRLRGGGGAPLPGQTRSFMEGRFGADFSGVRLHRGSDAAQLNREISAQAFTHGRDIYLGAGKENVESGDGRRLLAHELTHVVQQGAAPARVQRLIDRDGMIAKAGEPKEDVTFLGKTVRKMGQAYKELLSQLDLYKQFSQQAWVGHVGPNLFRDILNSTLDDVQKAARDYLSNHGGEEGRATFIQALVDKDIPEERQFVNTLAADPQFATFDRTRPLAEAQMGARAAATRPAKVAAVGITVDETPRDGHGMAVWARIDAGDFPIEDGENPRSVYGVTFQYWEAVDMEYDFKTNSVGAARLGKQNRTGQKSKPWNDVYAFGAEKSTFSKTSAPIELSWDTAVSEAKQRKLKGTKVVGIYDKPAVWAETERYAKRDLRFRIVYNDAFGTQRELFARQVVELNGQPTAALRSYTDSAGNAIASGGLRLGSGRRPPPPAPLGPTGGQGATTTAITASVPAEAHQALPRFAEQVKLRKSRPFIYTEMNLIKTRAPNPGAQELIRDDLSFGGPEIATTGGDTQYRIVGRYLLPPLPAGMDYKQFYLPSGGLLVGLVKDATLMKVYYTDNTVKPVETKVYKDWQVRSFTEVPIETVVPQASGLSDEMREAFKSHFGVLDYIFAHPRDYQLVATEYKKRFGDTFDALLTEYYEGRFRREGDSVPVFERIRDQAAPVAGNLVGLKVKPAYLAVFGKIKLEQTELASRTARGVGQQLAALAWNDGPGVLGVIRGNPGQGQQIEENYHAIFPGKKFGTLVFDTLVALFKANGPGKAFFSQALQTYADFKHLVIPAFRRAHGEALLKQVQADLRADELAAEVPNPDDFTNQMAELEFLLKGRFSLLNHTPSTGIGRFDAHYEPMHGTMRIVLKLGFEFPDFDTTKGGNVSSKAVGDLARTQWTEEKKTAYKQLLAQQTDAAWSNKFQIKCVRPGWTAVPPVRTRFEIQEVPFGQAHFVVKVNKAVVVDKESGEGAKTEKLTTNDSRSNVDFDGITANLQEWDLKDKMKDPEVHKYLHAEEKKQHVDKAYEMDRKRIEGVLKLLGRVEFRANSVFPKEMAQVDRLAQEIGRLVKFSSFSSLHPLVITGSVAKGESQALAHRRASAFSSRVSASGNPRVTATSTDDFAGVTVSVPLDPAVKNDYDQRWTRISAAHEIGHMIGLADEYIPAASVRTVKKMISDGLLPPDTPTDHLVGEGSGHGGQETKQEAFSKLLEETGMDSPDFTLSPNAKSTSIMTAGMDVMGMHYVTIWEALTKMTATHLDKKFWELEG